MICSLKFKKDVYLKNVALDFVLLVLKLYPIQVVISLPLWIKLTIVQLLLVFLCSFNSFFSYVGGVLVTNIFYTVRCTTKLHIIFCCFDGCSDISSSSENINSIARVSRLSFRFLWLWLDSVRVSSSFETQMILIKMV